MEETPGNADANKSGVDWNAFWKWSNDFCGLFEKESKAVWQFPNTWEIINILENARWLEYKNVKKCIFAPINGYVKTDKLLNCFLMCDIEFLVVIH